MTELSPAAQAVYFAFEDATTPEAALAAALRAAQDHLSVLVDDGTCLTRLINSDDLSAIADELEGK